MQANTSGPLKTVNVITISNANCIQLLDEQRQVLVDATNVCTRNTLEFGDEGMPLVSASNHKVIAIASVVFDDTTILPDIYTRVGSHVKWINDIILATAVSNIK